MNQENSTEKHHNYGVTCHNCGQFHTDSQVMKSLKNISIYKFKDFYKQEYRHYNEMKTVRKTNVKKMQEKLTSRAGNKRPNQIAARNAQMLTPKINVQSHKILLKNFSNDLNFDLSSIQPNANQLSSLEKSSFLKNLQKSNNRVQKNEQIYNFQQQKSLRPQLSKQNHTKKQKKFENLTIQIPYSAQEQTSNKNSSSGQIMPRSLSNNEQKCPQQVQYMTYQESKSNFKMIKGSNIYSPRYQLITDEEQTIQNQSAHLNEVNLFNYDQQYGSNCQEQLMENIEPQGISTNELVVNNCRYFADMQTTDIDDARINRQQQKKRIAEKQLPEELQSQFKSSFWDNQCYGLAFLHNQNRIDKQSEAFNADYV